MFTRILRVTLMLGRPLRNALLRFRSYFVKMYLKLHGIDYGPQLTMTSFPFCRRHRFARVDLGFGVTIRNRLSENAAGICHRTVLVAEGPGAHLIIGDHVGISGAVLFCTDRIQIDNYVNIGAGARIYDTDFHPVAAEARRRNDRNAIKHAPVRICEDAFVGANAIVLKGVTIGPRAIVGAGSVVTNDVPADSIVAGVPARVVGSVSSTRGHSFVDDSSLPSL